MMAQKHPKRPRDFSQAAKLVVDIASGEVADALGKAPNRAKGGHKGGKARAGALTPEQRSEIARAASTARWKKS
jgi:hypothetical protein